MPYVVGWMEECERMALRRWCFGLDVLEIGSYEGLSTVNIAATAKSVVAVDPFDGRATPEPRDTFQTFLSNIDQCGVAHKITVKKGLSQDILPTLKETFDAVFIDGAHDYESVAQDIRLSLRLLRPGGTLIFHDYATSDPGVVRAVDELKGTGTRALGQEHTLVALRPHGNLPERKETCVAVVMPHRDCAVSLGAAAGLMLWSTPNNVKRVLYNHGTSVLTQCFNTLLAEALNAREEEGATHLAMLHSDVIPSQGWLDILLEEMNRGGFDLVSAVVPLKNSKGLTSTGMDTPRDPWSVRRLTMKEVFELPETFQAKDVPCRKDEGPLLVNTGCWLMRLDQPWVEGMAFRQQDRLAYNETTKKYVAQSISEDWDWSRQLHHRGGRIAATRKVVVQHERPEFHTKHAWGEWETDRAYQNYEREVAASRERDPEAADCLV